MCALLTENAYELVACCRCSYRLTREELIEVDGDCPACGASCDELASLAQQYLGGVMMGFAEAGAILRSRRN